MYWKLQVGGIHSEGKRNKMKATVQKIENGYIIITGEDGHVPKYYFCATVAEVCTHLKDKIL